MVFGMLLHTLQMQRLSALIALSHLRVMVRIMVHLIIWMEPDLDQSMEVEILSVQLQEALITEFIPEC
jgi:hypothetical protein